MLCTIVLSYIALLGNGESELRLKYLTPAQHKIKLSELNRKCTVSEIRGGRCHQYTQRKTIRLDTPVHCRPAKIVKQPTGSHEVATLLSGG
jgi:hypothetical protein